MDLKKDLTSIFDFCKNFFFEFQMNGREKWFLLFLECKFRAQNEATPNPTQKSDLESLIIV